MQMKAILDLVKESIIAWFWSDAALHAAALAYYTLFSLAPLLILSIAIATQVFSQAAVEGRIVTTTENWIGTAGATVIQDIIKNSQNYRPSGVATGISILFLLYGASAVFRQLRNSLNVMWGLAPKADALGQSILTMLKSYLLSAVAVLVVGFLLLGILILTTLWTMMPDQYYEVFITTLGEFIPLIRILVSPLVYVVIFAIIFKTLPKAKIRWRDVWAGAAVTALLFWMGSYAVGLYLGYSVWTSVYGAAGSVIALLLWVYYSAWIFLFGAKFTHLYADKFGRPIVPDRDATFVTPPQPAV